MTLDDETASRIADEAWAKRGKRHTVSGEEYVRAGWDARDAEVEELRARLAKVRAVYDAWFLREAGVVVDLLLSDILDALDESPTERETPADEWEYGLADDGATEPYSDISTDRDWVLDGVHVMDEGTKLLRRRKAGPWEVVPDDRA